MSLQNDVRKGNQEPRVSRAPDWVFTHGQDAAFLAESYGLAPDPWQQRVIDAWLGETDDGKWSASRCGLSVPRQNGKNAVLEIVELYKLVQLGRRILHTAHEVKTARKAFLRLAGFFENSREYPELTELVDSIRRTNGQEAILLENGGSIEFIARSSGSGRGFTVDDIVCDEAQDLNEEALAALLPTVSAAPSGNPQVTFTGTPPSGNGNGAVWTRMRSEGVDMERESNLAWFEWSCAGDLDVTDIDHWYAANPALGIRLAESSVRDECNAFSAEKFATERLGMWASAASLSVIPADMWEKRAVDSAPDGDVLAYGVDMNPERTISRVCVAVSNGDGYHVELADIGDAAWDVESLVLWLSSRAKRRVPVVMDAFSPVVSIEPMLKQCKCKVWKLSGGELMQATGGFVDAVLRTCTLTHSGQEQLNDAVAGARKKTLGDAGGFKWDRKALDVEITPLVAANCAWFGAVKSASRRKKSSGGGKVLVV